MIKIGYEIHRVKVKLPAEIAAEVFAPIQVKLPTEVFRQLSKRKASKISVTVKVTECQRLRDDQDDRRLDQAEGLNAPNQ